MRPANKALEQTGDHRGPHLPLAIGVISAAGFLEPKLVYPRFIDRIELIDENASQRRLLQSAQPGVDVAWDS